MINRNDRSDRNFPLYWMTAPPALPKLLGEAVSIALQQGLCSVDDLPDRTEDWLADSSAVDRLLTDRGAREAHRQWVKDGAFVVSCPFWCCGDHQQLAGPGDAVAHRLSIVHHDCGDDRALDVVLVAWEDADGVSPPEVDVDGFDDVWDLTGEQVVFLAEALVESRVVLDRIEDLGRAR